MKSKSWSVGFLRLVFMTTSTVVFAEAGEQKDEFKPYLNCLAEISDHTSADWPNGYGNHAIAPGRRNGKSGVYVFNERYAYFFPIPKSKGGPGTGEFNFKIPATDSDHPAQEFMVSLDENLRIHSYGAPQPLDENRVIEGVDSIGKEARAALKGLLLYRFSQKEYFTRHIDQYVIAEERRLKAELERQEREGSAPTAGQENFHPTKKKTKGIRRLSMTKRELETLESVCNDIPDGNFQREVRKHILAHMPLKTGDAPPAPSSRSEQAE